MTKAHGGASMTKSIPLTQGKFALVDDDMYDYLNQWKWNFNGRYVCRSVGKWNHRTKIRMHHEVLNAPAGMEIDHIDGDALDNRRDKLRICTPLQNKYNRRKPVTNSSGYKGVTMKHLSKKWTAEIKVNQKKIYLGSFSDIQDAARAYDDAAKKYFGEFASLNFREQ